MTHGQHSHDYGIAGYTPSASAARGVPFAVGTALPDMILDHARDGIALLDIRGRLLWMNPALERMLGWPIDLIRGRNPAELINLPGDRPTPDELAAFRYQPDSTLFQKFRVSRHVRRDGSWFWNQQSHALIDIGPEKTQKMVVVTCRDITEQVRVQTALIQVKDDLEHAAHHDDLTGVGNRKKLTRYLASSAAQEALITGRMGVLQLDLDQFKQVNDTLGHAAGDALLRHVAKELSGCTRSADLICRTGGDEFLLICLDMPDPDALMRRADEILQRISRPFFWKDHKMVPGISVGASISSGGASPNDAPPVQFGGEALIWQADQALYAAKESGRGCAVLYSEELGARYRAERQISLDLEVAIEQNQFAIHLQPILHLGMGRITRCEALLRWHHPTRGVLTPADFMPAAQKAKLVSQIDRLSMNAALDSLKTLHEEGFEDLHISLNVSGSILEDADYPGLLDWALQTRGLAPASVGVEIQETTIMAQDALDGAAAIKRLRQMGVRVALDNFGTGYAGLAHMSSTQLDAIKLDRKMIKRLAYDARARIITRSVIHLCALLGMQVIAEGVETQAQLVILSAAKCPLIQGYGIARPMPIDQITPWLRENSVIEMPIRLPIGHESASSAQAPAAPRGDNSI
ncbi:MAG: EAL domain-containing protein [Rhodobacterales bacterium]|nr:EAL domain-containing protein [Rhodobacterales bacterium]